jgi:hypothetical protein
MVIVLSLVLSACGGGAGAAGAAGAAKAWFDAFAQLDLAKIKDLTCDKEKSAMDQAFSVFSGAGGTDTQALKDLFKIDVSGLKFEDKGQGTVHISGAMKLSAFGQSQDQNIDEDIPMVNEGGTWKVCGNTVPGQ